MLRLSLITLAFLANPARALDCAEGQRAFVHQAGETCVLESPQRIVTLQDQNALLPLLELGVRPVGSAGLVTPDGHEFRATQGYDTSSVAFVGSYAEPDREAVAALGPDLIVATPWPANAVETYGAIAPVVVIDMFGQPVDAALMQFAEAVNRTAEAEAMRAGFDAEVTALREKLGDRLARTTVSIVETWDGTINLVPEQQSMSVVVPALGLVRPPEERGLGDWTEISIEGLGGIEADVAILVATPDDQTGSPDEAVAAFMGQPVVQALPVVRAGQMVPVDAREIYGVSWATLSRATSKFGEILMRDDLNRDLVVE